MKRGSADLVWWRRSQSFFLRQNLYRERAQQEIAAELVRERVREEMAKQGATGKGGEVH